MHRAGPACPLATLCWKKPPGKRRGAVATTRIRIIARRQQPAGTTDDDKTALTSCASCHSTTIRTATTQLLLLKAAANAHVPPTWERIVLLPNSLFSQRDYRQGRYFRQTQRRGVDRGAVSGVVAIHKRALHRVYWRYWRNDRRKVVLLLVPLSTTSPNSDSPSTFKWNPSTGFRPCGCCPTGTISERVLLRIIRVLLALLQKRRCRQWQCLLQFCPDGRCAALLSCGRGGGSQHAGRGGFAADLVFAARLLARPRHAGPGATASVSLLFVGHKANQRAHGAPAGGDGLLQTVERVVAAVGGCCGGRH